MIEQFRVAAVRSIKQLAEVLKPVERFYPLIGAIGTEPIYDLDETFFEGLACQISGNRASIDSRLGRRESIGSRARR